MKILSALDLKVGDVIDYTPWCDEGETATVIIDEVHEVGIGRVSIKGHMMAVNGATQDEYGNPWENVGLLLVSDVGEEIQVL